MKVVDFNGDGLQDVALQLNMNNSSGPSGESAAPWGVPGDISVVGDFDGDKVLDFAVYRPSTGTWYIIPSSTVWRTPINMSVWGLPGKMLATPIAQP